MSELLPFLLFCFSTTITPGPNNLMLLHSGLHFGVKQSLPHFLGVCFGFGLMVFVVALGLGTIFLKYPEIKTLLKVVGSAYMLYLAWRTVSSNIRFENNIERKPLTATHAMLFQWVNPKAWIMTVGTISLFTLAENDMNNALLLSLTYFFMCIVCVGLWLVGGVFLQKILKNKQHQKWFNISLAVCLVASIALIFID